MRPSSTRLYRTLSTVNYADAGGGCPFRKVTSTRFGVHKARRARRPPIGALPIHFRLTTRPHIETLPTNGQLVGVLMCGGNEDLSSPCESRKVRRRG